MGKTSFWVPPLGSKIGGSQVQYRNYKEKRWEKNAAKGKNIPPPPPSFVQILDLPVTCITVELHQYMFISTLQVHDFTSQSNTTSFSQSRRGSMTPEDDEVFMNKLSSKQSKNASNGSPLNNHRSYISSRRSQVWMYINIIDWENILHTFYYYCRKENYLIPKYNFLTCCDLNWPIGDLHALPCDSTQLWKLYGAFITYARRWGGGD